MNRNPLLLSRDRCVLYGTLLTVLCLVQVRFVVAQGFGDWSAFWAAGATAGTRDLLDPARHAAWQTHHHLLTTIFPYVPGAAWLLVSAAHMPLAAGYALNFIVMAAAAAAAALIAARTYRISRALALVFAFAWAPTIAALATGQNAPLGLLLVISAAAAMTVGSWALCGLAVGLLLYKISYALPMIALLAVRRNVRALAVVGACAGAWYLASVAAAAGDWHWPVHYAQALQGYAAADARFNAVKAMSIPHLLMRLGTPPLAAMLSGLALFALAVPLLVRSRPLEAASFTPLLGLAFGPHTLPYDAALALPALYYVMTHAAQPLRTRCICALYLIAPLWLLSGVLRFDVLAVACDGLVLAWLWKGLHESTTRADIRIADSRNRSQA